MTALRLQIVALTTLLGQSRASLADQEPVACQDVQLHVTAGHAPVGKGGSLTFTVEVRNAGSGAVWIYGDLDPRVVVFFLNAAGQPVQPRLLPDHTPPPPRASDFILLRPNHSLLLNDRYLESELGLPSGEYSALVEYWPLQPPQELGVTGCTGHLKAAEILHFNVVP